MPDSGATASAGRSCQRCGRKLTDRPGETVCPPCLLDLALESGSDDPDNEASWLDGVENASAPKGRYEILEEIARGGMGVVYRARHLGLNRTVALKMILPAQLQSSAALERFRGEAEAVAALDHPGILPIYEVGELDGIPFFSMKLAQGGSLAEHLPEWHEHPRKAAALIALIARAVQHAHERGILHRDLKPGNILLGAEGEAFVTDFGIAKWMERDSALTLDHASLGTPFYTAPEQARGRSTELTIAADVYSLGAILYELLAGRPPFVGQSTIETLQLASETPAQPVRSIRPAVPRDLDIICLKCLAKEPAARYASAAALAGDLERWLDGRPILAHAVTKPERLWRWAKRNPALASLSALTLALLVAFAVGSTIAATRIGRSRDRAIVAEKEAVEKLYNSYLVQARVSRQAGQRLESFAAIEKASRIHRSAALRDETIAALALVDFKRGESWHVPPSLNANVHFDQNLERYIVEDEVGQVTVRSVADQHELIRLPSPPVALGAMYAFSVDGRFAAATFIDDVAWVWDLSSGRVVLRLPGQTSWEFGDVAFSPDGKLLAFAMPGCGIAFYRLDELPATGEIDASRPYRRWDDAPLCHRLAFDPSGTRLAMADLGDGPGHEHEGIFQVRALDADGKTFEVRKPVGYSCVDWSGDGKLVATAGWDHNIYLHDPDTGAVRQILRGHFGAVVEIRFSHHGRWLASSSFDGTVRLWEVATGALLTTTAGSGPINFSGDDHRLGMSFPDGNLGWVEIASSDVLRTLQPPRELDRPWSLAASPDGRLLASCGYGGIQLWDARTGEPLELPQNDLQKGISTRNPRNGRMAVRFAPDNSALIVSSRTEGFYRWSLRRGEADRLEIGAREHLFASMPVGYLLTDISADGRRLAITHVQNGYACLLPLTEDQPKLDLRGQPNTFQLCLSSDGHWAAGGARLKGGVRVWDARTGNTVIDLEPDEDAIVAFSPDNQWLLTGTALGYRFWKTGTWEKGAVIKPETGARLSNFAAAFSPKNDLVAVQQSADRIALYDARGSTFLGTLEAPRPLVLSELNFTGDGARLAALGANQVIQLWDLPALHRELEARGLDWTRP